MTIVKIFVDSLCHFVEGRLSSLSGLPVIMRYC